MPYMSQEKKKSIVAAAKPILKKYGVKATFAVDNHRTIVCNIKSAVIDLVGNFNETVSNDFYLKARGYETKKSYLQINPYHYTNHFSGKAKEFLTELLVVMNDGNHDNSDIMTDYFDVGWYVCVNIGQWDRPFVVDKAK